MIWLALLGLTAGLLCGRFVFSPQMLAAADSLTMVALRILVFAVGIQVGSDRGVFARVWRHGWRVLLAPVGVVVGSVGGSILAGSLLGLPANVSGAVGAGFGWYSFSAVLLGELAGAQVGTMAFLCNVFRELIALLTIPLVARYLGYTTAIAPGGATAMDVTLPTITRSTDETTAVLALFSGLLLSMLVPVLVPLLYQFL